ncbi:MAG: glycosyltransferase family 4 protein [Spirochaetaceae bacterium]|nr:MAG: glycosyltransferase family 4 protein [Spirochaetaceae bacterium]
MRNTNSETFSLVGNYLPRLCGIATFTTDLLQSMARETPDKAYWAVAMNDTPGGYEYPRDVRFEINQNRFQEYRLAADFLNMNRIELVCLQHEYGIFGGPYGKHILALLHNLRMPVVTTLHTVLQNPDVGQKETLEEILYASDKVVTMSKHAEDILHDLYAVERERIVFIPHGIPDIQFIDPNYYKDQFGVEGKKVLLTFGLLSPGKGIENVIDALPMVVRRYPETVYIVLGVTHPHVKWESGESYRIALQQRARALGIEKHLMFHNRFVSLEKLCEFIICADVYITPYLNREQITSGTLAYAVGAGKAVISTPYRYAEEMLADGRGKLVPFADTEAIAGAVLELFDDPVEMNAMRKRAYKYSRNMVWNTVARSYLDLFTELKQERLTRSRTAVQAPGLRPQVMDLPEIKLNHLQLLSDDTGILQHARFMIPSREHGYTADDNARALIVTMLAQDYIADANLLDQMSCRYLSFLDHAYDANTGRFRNYMSYNRRWSHRSDYEDCQARVLWSLGVSVVHSRKDSQIGMAMDLFERALPAFDNFRSPRALATGLLGILTYRQRFSGDRNARRYGEMILDRLYTICSENEDIEWPWIEETATYENSRIPQALIAAGYDAGRREILDKGLEMLDWLLSVQRDPSGHLTLIGNRGWYRRGKSKARFDQQPVEAGSLVEACVEAYSATRDPRWAQEAASCFEWFLGRNDLQAPLYDYVTGGCRDGLQPGGVNQNQGAESTLVWLMALLAMYRRNQRLMSAGKKKQASRR